VLGLDAPSEELEASLKVAAGFDLVKGFAIGRTILGDVARQWLANKISDAEAITEMAKRYRGFCDLWDRLRQK